MCSPLSSFFSSSSAMMMLMFFFFLRFLQDLTISFFFSRSLSSSCVAFETKSTKKQEGKNVRQTNKNKKKSHHSLLPFLSFPFLSFREKKPLSLLPFALFDDTRKNHHLFVGPPFCRRRRRRRREERRRRKRWRRRLAAGRHRRER